MVKKKWIIINLIILILATLIFTSCGSNKTTEDNNASMSNMSNMSNMTNMSNASK